MGRDLPTSLMQIRALLADEGCWFFFVEIARKAGGSFRLVDHAQHVRANGVWWQACKIEITGPSEKADGTMPQFTLTIPNVSRLPLAELELNDELLGQRVTLAYHHQNSTGEGAAGEEPFVPGLTWSFDVLKATANMRSLTLNAGQPGNLRKVPGLRINANNFPQVLKRGG